MMMEVIDDHSAIRFAQEVQRTAPPLLADIIAAPDRMVAVAEAAGLVADDFVADDLRIVWCGLDVARHRDRLTILRVIRQALREAGHWSDNAGIHDGWYPYWSDAALAKLATSGKASPGRVAKQAKCLHNLQSLWQRAEQLNSELRALHVAELPKPSQPRSTWFSQRRAANG